MKAIARLSCFATLCGILVTAAPARAGTKVSRAGGVSIDIPDGWKVEGDDRMFAVEDGTHEMGMLVLVVDKSNGKQALAGVEKLLAKKATHIKWSKKAKATELGGMKGISIDGSAMMHDKKVLTTIVIVGPTATGKGVMLFAGAEPAWMQAHGAALLASFESLRTTK